MRDVFIDELTKEASKNPDIFLITGDLGFGVLDDFSRDFPDQFLNAGVAEQNMTAVAAGMALEGRKVFTYSIGNFPTLRCLEQIRNDICYHDLDVTIVSVGGGFSYGQLGMSHHATEDLSIMRALPNINVLAPSTLEEVRSSVKHIMNIKEPNYLRLDKSVGIYSNIDTYEFGKASLARAGNDITLITCGGILEEVLQAADILLKQGVSCRVLSMHTIKPIDSVSILQSMAETKGIITIEENNILGGLGGAVSEVCNSSLVKNGILKRMGLDDTYSSIVGDQKYLRKQYGLSCGDIINEVKASILG